MDKKNELSRRDALRVMAGAIAGIGATVSAPAASAEAAGVPSDLAEEYRRFLDQNFLVSRSRVNALLNPMVTDFEFRTRFKYNPEFGYLLAAGRFDNGLDCVVCNYSKDESGARLMLRSPDRLCRINSYGNSFTECQSVSDGETFQERLGDHLGESIRNFGIGGWSSYQAYLRMLREEEKVPAPCVIFGIFSDDHFRSLNPIVADLQWQRKPDANFGVKPYLSVNSARDRFAAHANPCPTADSLFQLCDREWIWRQFKDEDYVKVMYLKACFNRGGSGLGKYYAMLREIAKSRDVAPPDENAEAALRAINTVVYNDGLYSTMRLIERIERYAGEKGKRVLYVLTYAMGQGLMSALHGQGRFDGQLIDFLRKRNLPYVDMLDRHRQDFRDYKCSPADYLRRFYIDYDFIQPRPRGFRGLSGWGHYNPMGCLFLSQAVRSPVASLLDPKPPALIVPT